jgi:hypothetical protein
MPPGSSPSDPSGTGRSPVSRPRGTGAVPCTGRAVLPVADRPEHHVGVEPVTVDVGLSAQGAPMQVPAFRPYSRASAGWAIAQRTRPKGRGGQQLSNTDRA